MKLFKGIGVLTLASIAALAFMIPGVAFRYKADNLLPLKPQLDLKNLSPSEEIKSLSLTPLKKGNTTTLGGTGQVVFTYYSTSKRYWEQGKTAFKFSYTIKSNWFAALAVTVKCKVGEQVGKEFDPEFSNSKNHIINPYQSISSSFWLYSTYTSVGLKKIRIYITDTVIPSWTYDTRDLGNQYVQTYTTISDPGPYDYGTETDDLHHPNDWDIILRAGQFADNTGTRYSTAAQICTFTNIQMTYYDNTDSYIYAFSDRFTIEENNWWGVCDEFAIAFTAMCRAMKIPCHFLLVTFWNDLEDPYDNEVHGVAEFWDGSQWVHADPTGPIINDPYVYNRWPYNWYNATVQIVHDADDDKYQYDPSGDEKLLWSLDMYLHDLGYYWGY